MDIGKPQRTKRIEPVKLPIPERQPAEKPAPAEPKRIPRREPSKPERAPTREPVKR